MEEVQQGFKSHAGFDAAAIRRHAETFGRRRFEAEMRGCIDEVLTNNNG